MLPVPRARNSLLTPQELILNWSRAKKNNFCAGYKLRSRFWWFGSHFSTVAAGRLPRGVVDFWDAVPSFFVQKSAVNLPDMVHSATTFILDMFWGVEPVFSIYFAIRAHLGGHWLTLLKRCHAPPRRFVVPRHSFNKVAHWPPWRSLRAKQMPKTCSTPQFTSRMCLVCNYSCLRWFGGGVATLKWNGSQWRSLYV